MTDAVTLVGVHAQVLTASDFILYPALPSEPPATAAQQELKATR